MAFDAFWYSQKMLGISLGKRFTHYATYHTYISLDTFFSEGKNGGNKQKAIQ